MQSVTAPPEVTSALVHNGPAARSLIEASGACRQLGTYLDEYADGYVAALSSLVDQWRGRSAAAMVQSAEPYLVWLRTTAQQCRRTAASMQQAAAAFETVRTAVAPTATIKANRTRRVQLLASNRFGTPLTAPPAAAGFLAATQAPVQLASSAAPLPASQSTTFAGVPPIMPPMVPPSNSAGSGWRKRKQQKYEDLAVGLELRGPVMPKPPSAG